MFNLKYKIPEETRFCTYIEETEGTGEDTGTTETEETEDTGFFAGITGAFIGTLGTTGSLVLILTVILVVAGLYFLMRYINKKNK